MARSWWVRALLIGVGAISLVLGFVGVFLPLLPTTPFLLLAAACFLRSSQRLYDWLIHHPWLGSYIRNYREHGAMTLRAKVTALTLLWLVIGHSAVMAAETLWLRVLLLVIALAVTTHIALLKTMRSPDAGFETQAANEGMNADS